MNIKAVTAGTIQAIEGVRSDTTRARGVSRDIGPATVPNISDAASMLSKLKDLQSSDPAKFQSTMKDMADHLRAAAKEQGGKAGEFLNGMADKVTEAAKTGDLSALKPPPGGAGPMGGMHGHGGPPPGGGGGGGPSGGASEKSTSLSKDPADANGDGTVSALEKLAYDLKHPKATETKTHET
jgi:hypothetical protein